MSFESMILGCVFKCSPGVTFPCGHKAYINMCDILAALITASGHLSCQPTCKLTIFFAFCLCTPVTTVPP